MLVEAKRKACIVAAAVWLPSKEELERTRSLGSWHYNNKTTRKHPRTNSACCQGPCASTPFPPNNLLVLLYPSKHRMKAYVCTTCTTDVQPPASIGKELRKTS